MWSRFSNLAQSVQDRLDNVVEDLSLNLSSTEELDDSQQQQSVGDSEVDSPESGPTQQTVDSSGPHLASPHKHEGDLTEQLEEQLILNTQLKDIIREYEANLKSKDAEIKESAAKMVKLKLQAKAKIADLTNKLKEAEQIPATEGADGAEQPVSSPANSTAGQSKTDRARALVLKKKLSESEKLLASKEEELQENHRILAQQKEVIETLSQQLQQNDQIEPKSKTSNLEAQIRELKDEIEEHKEIAKDKDQIVKMMQSNLEDKEQALESQATKIASLQTQMEAYQTSNSESMVAAQQQGVLQKRMEEETADIMERKFQEMSELLTSKTEAVALLQNDLLDKEKMVSDREKAMALLNEKYEVAHEQMRSMQETFVELEGEWKVERDRLEKEVLQLKAQGEGGDVVKDAPDDHVQQLMDMVQQLRGTNQCLEDSASKDKAEFEKQLNEKLSEILSLKSQLQKKNLWEDRAQQLELQIREKDELVEGLKSQAQYFMDAVEKHNQESSEKEELLLSQRNELTECKANIQDLCQKNEQIMNENECLKTELQKFEDSEKSREAMVAERDVLSDELREHLELLQSSLEEKDLTMTNVIEQDKQLNVQLNQKEVELTGLKSKLDSVENERESFQKQVEVLTSQLEDVQKQQALTDETSHERLSVHLERIASLQSELAEANKLAKCNDELLSQKCEEINQFTEKLDLNSKEIEEMKVKLDSAGDHAVELNTVLSAKCSEIESLNEALLKVNENKDKLGEEIAKKVSDIEMLKDRVTDLESQVTTAHSREDFIKQLQKQISESEESLMNKNSEMDAIKEELVLNQNKVSELRKQSENENVSLVDEMAQKTTRIGILEKQCEELERSLQDSDSELNDVRNQLMQIALEKVNLSEALAQKAVLLSTLSEKVDALEQENAKYERSQSASDEMSAILTQNEETISNLQEQVAYYMQQMTQIQELQTHVDVLQNEKANLIESVQQKEEENKLLSEEATKRAHAVEQFKENIEQKDKQIEEITALKKEQDANILKLDQLLETTSSDLLSLRKQCEESDQWIQEKDAKIESLLLKCKDMATAIKAKEAEVSAIKNKMDEEVCTITTSLEKTQSDLDIARESIRKQSNEVQQSSEESNLKMNSLVEQLNESMNLLQQKELVISELESKLNYCEENYNQELSSRAKECSDKDALIISLEENLAEEKMKCADLEKHTLKEEQLQAQLAESKKDEITKEEKLKSLMTNLQEVEEQLQLSSSQIDALQAQLDESRQETKDVLEKTGAKEKKDEENMKKYVTLIKKLKLELKQSRDHALVLEKEVDVTKTERDDLKLTLEELKVETVKESKLQPVETDPVCVNMELSRENATLREDLQEKHHELHTLRNDLDHLKKMQSLCSDYESQIQTLNAEKSELVNEYANFKLNFENLSHEKNKVTGYLEDFKRQLDSTAKEKASLEQQFKTAEKSISMLEARNRNVEVQCKDLDSKVHSLAEENKEVKDQLENRNDQMQALGLEFERQSRTLVERENEFKTCSSKIEAFRAVTEEKELHIRELGTKLEKAEKELSERRLQNESLVTELECLNKDMSSLKSERERLADVERKLQLKEQEYDALKSDYVTVKQGLSSSEDELQQLKTDLSSQVNDLRCQLEEQETIRAQQDMRSESLDSELSTLRCEKEKLEEEVQKLDKEVLEVSSARDKAKEEFEMAKVNIGQLQAILDKSASEITKLRNEKENLKERVSITSAELETKLTIASDLEKVMEEKCKDFNMEISECQARLSSAEVEKNALIVDLKDARQQILVLEDQKNVASEKLQRAVNLDNDLEKLNSELSSSTAKNEQLCGELNSLKDDLTSKTNLLLVVQDQLKQSSESVTKLQTENAHHMARLQSATDSYNSVHADNEKLREVLSKLEHDKQQLVVHVETLVTDNKRLSNEVASAKTELSNYSTLAATARQYSKLQSQHASLKEQYDEIVQRSQSHTSHTTVVEMETLREKNEDLLAELSGLREEAVELRKENAKLLEENIVLEHKVEGIPTKYYEMKGDKDDYYEQLETVRYELREKEEECNSMQGKVKLSESERNRLSAELGMAIKTVQERDYQLQTLQQQYIALHHQATALQNNSQVKSSPPHQETERHVRSSGSPGVHTTPSKMEVQLAEEISSLTKKLEEVDQSRQVTSNELAELQQTLYNEKEKRSQVEKSLSDATEQLELQQLSVTRREVTVDLNDSEWDNAGPDTPLMKYQTGGLQTVQRWICRKRLAATRLLERQPCMRTGLLVYVLLVHVLVLTCWLR